MTTILVGECSKNNLFEIWDADAALETEFELIVAKALFCTYPGYHCFPFGGTFKYEGYTSRPDVALVAKDLSHWFVIEVELVSHSFEKHVLPQVRNFRYGVPQQDCLAGLMNGLSLDRPQVETFVRTVPRTVAVIANRYHRDWDIALRAHQIQLLSVTVFNSPSGVQAVEIDGKLIAQDAHFGWGVYSQTDRAIRFHHAVPLPDGEVMIDDFSGKGTLWKVTRSGQAAWASKAIGVPDITEGEYVQLIRAIGGRFSIRRSPVR